MATRVLQFKKKPIPIGLAIPRVHSRNVERVGRFRARHAWMLSVRTWVYYPEEDRYEEIVSAQPGKYSPNGHARIMPGLQVYGREVYAMTDHEWNLFIRYHPGAVCRFSAEFRPPSEAGLVDVDAFAVAGGTERTPL